MESMDTGKNTVEKITLLIVPVILLWSLLYPWAVKAGASNREIVEGDSVPIAILDDIAGNRHRIPDDETMTVVLFWATWSPRSVQAIDLWEGLSRGYPDELFQVVSVVAEKDELGDEDVNAIKAYVHEKQVSLPVVVDENLELFNSYGVKALPTVFMLDDNGLILYRYSGLPTSASLDLREELETRLGLKGPDTSEDKTVQTSLVYQPENNALLFFRMGNVFEEKGYFERAVEKYIEALVKDIKYEDPLRALERVYFRDGRTPDAEERLKARLSAGGLGELVDRVFEAEIPAERTEENKKIPAGNEPLSPVERMQLLMEKNGEQ